MLLRYWKSFTKEVTFLDTEAAYQTGKREKDIQGIGKNAQRSRNMTEQALTDIQCITQ